LDQLLLKVFGRVIFRGVPSPLALTMVATPLLCPDLDKWLRVGLRSLPMVAYFKSVLKSGAQSVTSYDIGWKLASTKLR
jgi:hypothetical protein